MARGGVPFHVVGYQPSASAAPDYLIVNQCGFILRRYGVPLADRYDFASAPEGEAVVRDWVTTNNKPGRPPTENESGLIGFLHTGLLGQLRSTPISLRVDAWILQDYPELLDLQKKALSRQLNDNAAALRPDVLAAIPDAFITANVAMSAAFALFCSERLNQPQIALPYVVSGYAERGKKLLSIWNDVSPDPSADLTLIDAWADALGLRNWYKWIKA